jgi:hypothetical protein
VKALDRSAASNDDGAEKEGACSEEECRTEAEEKTRVELPGEEALLKSASYSGNNPDIESGRDRPTDE